MTDAGEKSYSLYTVEGSLVFRTADFSVGKGSVLHSGIYNREFASMLASFAAAMAGYGLLVLGFGRKTGFYFAAMFFFIGAFPLFRMFVFKERFLEARFDCSAGIAQISVPGPAGNRTEKFPLSSIGNVLIETKKFGVENPDGVEFVEKISAQHGMVIPGFGEEKVLYVLKLILEDGSDRLIYAAETMEDAMSVHEKIKEFLKI